LPRDTFTQKIGSSYPSIRRRRRRKERGGGGEEKEEEEEKEKEEERPSRARECRARSLPLPCRAVSYRSGGGDRQDRRSRSGAQGGPYVKSTTTTTTK